ncbi:DUF3173 family protein, partial [Streptococcus agalactiae]|uniref:DUF3173 family protein n=1 Tax=Streptococcus agalactiae TaxID=1311 RepID=UPI00363F7B7F
MTNTKVTVKHIDLMKIGFPENTAREIIKQAKAIAVTNQGGVDDKSFNQSAWEGLQK